MSSSSPNPDATDQSNMDQSNTASQYESEQKPKILVLISGSGSNLQAIIDAVQSRQVSAEICAVISNKPDVKGLQRAIEAATADLVEERRRLETLQGKLEADMQRRRILVDERLGQTAQVYGAMKPKEAARALEGMDDDMAVAILERLPGRSVGKLFDVLPKDRVRQLTLRLEEGRANNTGE